MKRLFFLIFSLFFYSILLFSEGKDYLNIRITPEVALMNGLVKEYVFDENCTNDNNILSRLDWGVKNIALFKINAEVDILDYIHTGVNFSIGVPGKSGEMEDYDWMNSITESWSNDSPAECTNYSCHTNTLEKYLTFGAALGGNILLPADIKLTPFLGYSYDFIAFIGEDGYSSYKSNDWKEESFSGKVISYKQETNSILTGFKLAVTSVPRTYLYSDFSFSPALSFTNAMDYHHLTSNAYWDKFSFIWTLQSNIRAQYIFNQNHSAGIAGYFQFIPRQKSITYQKTLSKEGLPARGKWSLQKEKGGLERILWSISLNYSFSL